MVDRSAPCSWPLMRPEDVGRRSGTKVKMQDRLLLVRDIKKEVCNPDNNTSAGL